MGSDLRTTLEVPIGRLYSGRMIATATRGRRRRAQAGAGLVEYALILSIVAMLSIGGLFLLGGMVRGTLSSAGSRVGSGAVAGAVEPPATICPAGKVPKYNNNGNLDKCEKVDEEAIGLPPTTPDTAVKPSCTSPKILKWKNWEWDDGQWKDGGWECKKP